MSGFTIPEIEPRLFSFNAPYGACPTCDGLGTEQTIDPDLVVPDPDRTLRDGAKWPNRDRRQGTEKRDVISFDVFSPWTIGRMQRDQQQERRKAIVKPERRPGRLVALRRLRAHVPLKNHVDIARLSEDV